ncbi:hypothetical protein KIN20_020879 [Parelaphostrongylus tenuis]|uniref:Uncharacterized protein n=1 Tax=Parelaphostrongylus tenuis TaxID=148309 RepID=A0AAD5MN43_PARTN|nr:hypothetical protein KIN20_020879 [Parelaphostrongylus tenuis]
MQSTEQQPDVHRRVGLQAKLQNFASHPGHREAIIGQCLCKSAETSGETHCAIAAPQTFVES